MLRINDCFSHYKIISMSNNVRCFTSSNHKYGPSITKYNIRFPIYSYVSRVIYHLSSSTYLKKMITTYMWIKYNRFAIHMWRVSNTHCIFNVRWNILYAQKITDHHILMHAISKSNPILHSVLV